VLLAVALLAASLARGVYVVFVEHPERQVVQVGLPDNEWTDVMRWVAETPPATHVLADPGHGWRYGTSVRVAGQRDVFQEEVKDAAIAMYSRDIALRVYGRLQALDRFDALTVARARRLAHEFDLDYLVAEQTFDLPIVYANRRFRVYRLR
jgi:hypothetical protein